MSLDEGELPRRKVDTSNADARRAIAETLARFPAWRDDLARFAVVVERRFTQAERETMLARCTDIATQVQNARVALLETLIEAPQLVASHSRVSDVEKALDGVETTLSSIRRKLTQ